jgi:predicted permease
MRAPFDARCYGWLLRCYPGGFRARFETGMRDAFLQDCADARARGVAAVAAFWIVTAAQAVVFGLAERRPPKGTPMHLMSSTDWRDAWRSLRATPVITMVAVVSLALGTGANTALFSILNSLLYKSLPVREPARLALIDDGAWTNPIWEQLRDRQNAFSEGAFAWSATRFDLSEQGQTEFVPGAYASGKMFEVLGLSPAVGRLLGERDDVRGRPADTAQAVIGYDLWQRRFSGASDVVGRTIRVQRVPFTIVGVMPRGFFGPDVGTNVAVVLPLAAHELVSGSRTQLEGRATWWLEIMLRLRPGQTRESAAAALNGFRPQVREATLPSEWRTQDLQSYLGTPWTLVPAATGMSGLRTQYRDPLTVVLAIVGVVLVIACANIANVLIARSSARRHELSVRLALGATRGRLARQLLLESVMMAAGGAALGLLFAQWAGALVIRQISSTAFLDLTPDLRVLGFTAGAAILTALLFGIAPSLGMLGIAPTEALGDRGRVGGETRFGVRAVLVVVQIALSLALVVGAALFARTFSSLLARPLGFDSAPVAVASINVQKAATGEARAILYERARAAVAAIPGVEAAALSYTTPVGNASWNTLISVPDHPNLPERDRAPRVNALAPAWFTVYGMPLVAGRGFDAHDVKGSPDVAVVTRTFAARYFKTGDPIGQQIHEETGPRPRDYRVVGIVEDSAYRSLRAAVQPIMYVPLAQTGDLAASAARVELSVRARSGAADSLIRPITTTLEALDPNLALTVRPLSLQLEAALRQERLVAMLSGFFGGLALLLAAIGLYGVTAYSVSRRRAEIGLRMALGARPDRIVRLVLRRAGWLVAAGAIAGLTLSMWAAGYVRALLYGVGEHDPITLAASVVVLMAVALISAWLPARRASRIDPTIALRGE